MQITPEDFQKIKREALDIPLMFLSGPFTSGTVADLEKMTLYASDVAYKAWLKGWAVISVHKNCLGFEATEDMDYRRWMVALMAQIAVCDAVLALPGWEESAGCWAELEFAHDMGIPIHTYDGETIPEPKSRKVIR